MKKTSNNCKINILLNAAIQLILLLLFATEIKLYIIYKLCTILEIFSERDYN